MGKEINCNATLKIWGPRKKKKGILKFILRPWVLRIFVVYPFAWGRPDFEVV